MTELWLIRHGETDWNLQGRLQGQADPPLNETGWRQAHEVAGRLAGNHFSAVYSSDLLRARQTAEVIGNRVGLAVRYDARWREVNHGQWDGMLTDEVAARYPEAWLARRAKPLEVAPPGGETVLAVAARTRAAASDVAARHPGGRVIVVSHGLALATLICQGRGHPLSEAFDRIPPNAQPEVIVWPPA